jgi:hypothetical protein
MYAEGHVKLAESRLGRSRLGRVNGRDENASRLDLRRPSLLRTWADVTGVAMAAITRIAGHRSTHRAFRQSAHAKLTVPKQV